MFYFKTDLFLFFSIRFILLFKNSIVTLKKKSFSFNKIIEDSLKFGGFQIIYAFW
jgi:hypothetical protein